MPLFRKNFRIWPIFAKVVEHQNMFWRLEKHAKTTANTRMQPKNPSLLIYEVLIGNTLNRTAMFFFGHPYLDSLIIVLSDHFTSSTYIG